jgi:hypothetical protein
MDLYSVLVYDWLPSQAAMTALIPSGAAAATPRGQLLSFLHPSMQPTNRCKREEKP